MTVRTNSNTEGYGLTFTCGRGTDIVAYAVKTLKLLIVGRNLRNDIFGRFGLFWRELTSESQLRWVSVQSKEKIVMNFFRKIKCYFRCYSWDQKKVLCILLLLQL